MDGVKIVKRRDYVVECYGWPVAVLPDLKSAQAWVKENVENVTAEMEAESREVYEEVFGAPA